MKKIILVAGATGNLGERIIKALLQKDVMVRVLVRQSSNSEIVNRLEKSGAEIYKITNWNVAEITAACADVTCVVSALAGLRDVVIDAQKILLDAAIAANVPRFIPSDYSLDFTKFSAGENRNLDLRREFHAYLDSRPIKATSIFNGAFAELLTGEMPLILFKQKLILYWGHADHKMIFTTMDNTAEYTANAAIDDSAPRYLRIAGDQISPREIRAVVARVTRDKYKFIRTGGQGLLGIIIKIARKFAPGKNELYPAWQGMQYMHNMIDDRSNIITLDNNRYTGIRWTTAEDVLTQYQKSLTEN